MTDEFKRRFGPWALVSGASSGIGEHFARQLAERGLNLVITARRSELLDRLAGELRDRNGVQVEVVAADLGRTDFLAAIVRACADKDVGLVVSNAGFGLKGALHRAEAAQLEAMLHVNCLAPTMLAHAFAPRLLARGRGGLLFTGSIEGFVAFPWSTAYSATKAYVTFLGEGLSEELKRGGVDVLVLAPGSTDTAAPILQGFDRSQLVGLMTPADVARQGLDRLGRVPVFIPGWINRLMVGFLTLVPRRVGVRLAGMAMKTALERAGKGPWPSA